MTATLIIIGAIGFVFAGFAGAEWAIVAVAVAVIGVGLIAGGVGSAGREMAQDEQAASLAELEKLPKVKFFQEPIDPHAISGLEREILSQLRSGGNYYLQPADSPEGKAVAALVDYGLVYIELPVTAPTPSLLKQFKAQLKGWL
jgi:hypothetical protein